MQGAVVGWLDGIASTAFTLSAWTFVGVNGFAIAMLAWKRDPHLVNRWTSRFLAVNVLLLGTGLGVPMVALAARSAIISLSPAMHIRPTAAEIPDASGDAVGAAEVVP
jgi:hypothetical protein